MNKPEYLYALDFDGVICDSAIETGMSGWKVAAEIWPEMPDEMPDQILTAFRQVRPAMETGYEAILICRLLYEKVLPSLLIQEFAQQLNSLMERDQLKISELKGRFGRYRDKWIETDLSGWIKRNPLFPGIHELLQSIPVSQRYIITTKQERFVKAIMEANQIDIPTEQIYGLDRQMSKTQVLCKLQNQQSTAQIVFVEDRLPTLLNVLNEPLLQSVKLGFAAWGYNTESDKKKARCQPIIKWHDSPQAFEV